MNGIKKLLVIDDDKSICALLKLKLENTGRYQVDYALDAGSGMAIAMADKPDLIILDIMMPDLQGGDLAHILSENPATQDIPVIFWSSLVPEDALKSRGGMIGGLPMVSKSSDLSELKSRIDGMLADTA